MKAFPCWWITKVLPRGRMHCEFGFAFLPFVKSECASDMRLWNGSTFNQMMPKNPNTTSAPNPANPNTAEISRDAQNGKSIWNTYVNKPHPNKPSAVFTTIFFSTLITNAAAMKKTIPIINQEMFPEIEFVIVSTAPVSTTWNNTLIPFLCLLA